MKITFEGQNFLEIAVQMRELLLTTVVGQPASQDVLKGSIPEVSVDDGENSPTVHDDAQGSSPEAQGSNGAAPAQPSKTPKTPKTKAKPSKAKAAPEDAIDPTEDAIGLDPAPTPAEMVAIRQKTIEDLQAAYSGGKQKEVFKLLAEHGNGAKSFRELTAEAFLPIRKAIDQGALA